MSCRKGLAFYLLLLGIGMAHAQLPNVNLGITSFMDGMPPPGGPGWYMQEYFQYYHAGHLNNSAGQELLIPTTKGTLESPQVEAWALVNQIFYQSGQAIVPGNGRWGASFTLPAVAYDVGPSEFPAFREKTLGIGDIFFGPSIQWDPIMGKTGPIFSHRIDFDGVFPVGTFDSSHQLSAGGGQFSFNPYWAGTLFLRPEWNISWRMHYLWNSRNDETGIQPGQAVHLNFATSWEVIPHTLHLGINGYYLQQITESNFYGVDLKNSEERVVGVGPGLLYTHSEKDLFFFNTYFETFAENRAEGMRFTWRWMHKF